MQNYYNILGVSETASTDEIKKAYRSLAMKHHPDRGGDQTKFKDISAAYDTLSDPQKKAEYDQMRMGGAQANFGGGFHEFHDIFGNSPFGAHFQDIFGRHPRMPRNRDLNIQCQITLLESYQGKQLEASYTLPSGRSQSVVINVPAGVENGSTIRYQGLGDDSIPQAPRGNLNVTIIVAPDSRFTRQGDDLYTTLDINPIEAMIGCKKIIQMITGQQINLDVRPGVETGTEFASTGKGFPNPHTNGKGRFVIVINIKTPAINDPAIVARLREINRDITGSN